MPLSLNEIRDRARAFAKEWTGVTSERAEAQTFWNDFFNVFGVNRRRVAVFEQKARRFSAFAGMTSENTGCAKPSKPPSKPSSTPVPDSLMPLSPISTIH